MAETLKQRADRWLDEGAADIRRRAEAKGKRIEAQHKYPTYRRPQDVKEGSIGFPEAKHVVNGKEQKQPPK